MTAGQLTYILNLVITISAYVKIGSSKTWRRETKGDLNSQVIRRKCVYKSTDWTDHHTANRLIKTIRAPTTTFHLLFSHFTLEKTNVKKSPATLSLKQR